MYEERAAHSDERLRLQAEEQTLVRIAMDGAGLARWGGGANTAEGCWESSFRSTQRPIMARGRITLLCVAVTADIANQ
jgi:hypothetical protein